MFRRQTESSSSDSDDTIFNPIFTSGKKSTKSKGLYYETDSGVGYHGQGSAKPTSRYTFGHGKGRAIRDTNDEFLNVWEPFDSSNPLDRKAAHEAARRDAEIKANKESRKPGCIGVLQDGRGNAMSSYSVKGPSQDPWKSKMSKTQKSALNKIPESQRGAGHRFCAEQVLTQNKNHITKFSSDSFFEGECTATAYERSDREGFRYNKKKPACKTCKKTNKFEGFFDGAKKKF